MFGEPDENRMVEGKDIDIEFKGELRDYQKPIIKIFYGYMSRRITFNFTNLWWCNRCSMGYGKC